MGNRGFVNRGWLAANGVSAVVAITPIVAVGGALLLAAVICIAIIVVLAFRHRSTIDPPLENEVFGDWFEPDRAADQEGARPVEAAAVAAAGPDAGIALNGGVGSNGQIAAAADGDALGATVTANGDTAVATTGAAAGGANGELATNGDGHTAGVAASALTEPALHSPAAGSAAGTDVAPSAVPAGFAPANAPAAPAPMTWEPAFAPTVAPDAGEPAPDRTGVEPGPEFAPASEFEPVPQGGEEFDYGSLERDLGFTERTGGALAVGIASIVLVVLIGLWLVASAHHGTGTPVHIVHSPQVGPPGPQGSPGP